MLRYQFQVRLLHISEPTHLVMGIVGKKYPLNKEEFRAARLPGQFDVKRAGKRMALTVPETWETQVHNYSLQLFSYGRSVVI